MVAYSTNSTSASIRPANEWTGLVLSNDTAEDDDKNQLPEVGERTYEIMLRCVMSQSSAAHTRFPLGSGANAHGDCPKLWVAARPGRNPMGDEVEALIACIPTFNDTGVDPIAARISG